MKEIKVDIENLIIDYSKETTVQLGLTGYELWIRPVWGDVKNYKPLTVTRTLTGFVAIVKHGCLGINEAMYVDVGYFISSELQWDTDCASYVLTIGCNNTPTGESGDTNNPICSNSTLASVNIKFTKGDFDDTDE